MRLSLYKIELNLAVLFCLCFNSQDVKFQYDKVSQENFVSVVKKKKNRIVQNFHQFQNTELFHLP